MMNSIGAAAPTSIGAGALLYNIGEKELDAGELRQRGYYLGSQRLLRSEEARRTRLLDHQRSRSIAARSDPLDPQGQISAA